MTTGLEGSFLESWQGWDELDTGDLFFTAVKVKMHVQAMLGEDFEVQDMALLTSKSLVEFYDADGESRSFEVQLQFVQ